MWAWTCSACGEKFTAPNQAQAEGGFMEHARTAHSANVILSFKERES